MICCFEALQLIAYRKSFDSDRDFKEWTVWFRSGLQSTYRESFDLDQNVGAGGRDVFISTGDKKLFSRGRDA